MRSLPVSAIPRTSIGGVPIDTFIRYSPALDIILDWIFADDDDDNEVIIGLTK